MLPSESTHRFAVGGDRTDVARFFLGSSAVASMLVTMATLWTTGAPGDPAVLGAHTMAVALADGLHGVTMIALAVWIHRAYANLSTFGAATSLRPVTAAAYFVVPGANLLVPHTVFRELWRGSAPSNPTMFARPIALVMHWWYLFIAASVSTNIGVAWLIQDPDGARARAMLIIAPVLASLAALGGMDVINLIDARQSVRRNVQRMRMDRTPAAAAAPTPQPAAAKRADWTAALLPMATVIEKEMATAEAEPPPLPAAASAAVDDPVRVGPLPQLLTAIAILAGVLTLVAVGIYVDSNRALAQLYRLRWVLYALTAFAGVQFYRGRKQLNFEFVFSTAGAVAGLWAILFVTAQGLSLMKSYRLLWLVNPPLYGLWVAAALMVRRGLEQQPSRAAEDIVAFEATGPVEAMPVPENLPRNLAPAPNRPVLVLLGIVTALAALQGLFCLVAAMRPDAEGIAFAMAIVPFAFPVYALSFAAAILFAVWIGRAYANLRAYVPELPRDDAAGDFVRGAGNPAVLEELWYVSMSDLPHASAVLVTLWAKSWRSMQFAAVMFAIGIVVAPDYAASLVGAAMFLLWSASSVLALLICREIGIAQRQRLMLVSRAAAAATHAGPLPPPLPT